VSRGKAVYIDEVNLIAISCFRKNSTRKSSGKYNYEMWEIKTKNNEFFYCGNITKTNVFYCYISKDKLEEFFIDNTCESLAPGMKEKERHGSISDNVWDSFDDKFIPQKLQNSIDHQGLEGEVLSCNLHKSIKTKRGAFRNYEIWEIVFRHTNSHLMELVFSNFDNPTDLYYLSVIGKVNS
jgi:hypothetical protein